MDIQTLSPQDFPDYELLDSGNERKLERFGKYVLNRIETQALWKPSQPDSLWDTADAVYKKRNEKNGEWVIRGKIPSQWEMSYKDYTFWLKLTPFGHVGVFPEQSVQWDWIEKEILRPRLNRNSEKNDHSSVIPAGAGIQETLEEEPMLGGQADLRVRKDDNYVTQKQSSNETIQQSNNRSSVLNLFSYTGISSLVAAHAGAFVTHVDASKPAITWARENQKLSRISETSIRWIADDALKFVKREVRRGARYNGIIMDPPKFGRGTQGEVWKFEGSFPELLDYCRQILLPEGFLLITAYAVPISAITLNNMVKSYFPKLEIESGELILQESKTGRQLSTAIFTRG